MHTAQVDGKEAVNEATVIINTPVAALNYNSRDRRDPEIMRLNRLGRGVNTEASKLNDMDALQFKGVAFQSDVKWKEDAVSTVLRHQTDSHS